MNATWMSKKMLKTGKTWSKSEFIKKKPKDISHEDWQQELRIFKYEKLVVLNQVPKISKKEFVPREKDE